MTDLSPAREGPVSIPGALQFDMASKISGRDDRVFVFKPLLPPPPEGYPMVMASDGKAEDHATAFAASIARALDFALQP